MFLFTSAVLHYHVSHACMLVCMLSVDNSLVLKENHSQLKKHTDCITAVTVAEHEHFTQFEVMQ